MFIGGHNVHIYIYIYAVMYSIFIYIYMIIYHRYAHVQSSQLVGCSYPVSPVSPEVSSSPQCSRQGVFSCAMNFVARVEIQKLTTDIFCFWCYGVWLVEDKMLRLFLDNILCGIGILESFFCFSDVRHGESTERNPGE